MIEFLYDDGYSPPAPVCQVFFEITHTGQSVGPLGAIVDTGADGTLVPQQYLDEIGARPVMETGLRSQWGERRVVYLYLVFVRIGDIELPGIYVVGDEQSNEVVIGRNELNELRIWLDGPAGITRVSAEE